MDTTEAEFTASCQTDLSALTHPAWGVLLRKSSSRALEHPHAWWRETAQRLLLERREGSAGTALKRLVRTSDLPQGRLHAIWTLDGLGELDEATLLLALEDEHPDLRQNAVRLAKSRIKQSKKVRNKLISMAGDAEARVRFQTVLAISEFGDSSSLASLASIAQQDFSDEWTRTAILMAVSNRSADLFGILAAKDSFRARKEAVGFLTQWAEVVGARHEPAAISKLLKAATRWLRREPARTRFLVSSGLAEGLVRSGSSLSELLRADSAYDSSAKSMVAGAFQEAGEVALDTSRPQEERLAAIRLLGHAAYETVVQSLSQVLAARESAEIQLSAVRALSVHPQPGVGELLVEKWRTFSPSVRAEVVESLFSRPNRLPALLAGLEQGTVASSQLEPIRRRTLLEHSDSSIRERAAAMLTDETPEDRKAVVDRYQGALGLEAERARGAEVFMANCATCHQAGSQGHQVGPDLSTVQGRISADLLMDILNPNAKVQSNYVNYRLDTTNGVILTGIIVRETANSVTVRRAEGVEDVVPRSSIKELTSMGLSIMPDEFEKRLDLQQIADLIRFIQSGEVDSD